jgi:hypothetical protein
MAVLWGGALGWCYWDYPVVPISLYVVVGSLAHIQWCAQPHSTQPAHMPSRFTMHDEPQPENAFRVPISLSDSMPDFAMRYEKSMHTFEMERGF